MADIHYNVYNRSNSIFWFSVLVCLCAWVCMCVVFPCSFLHLRWLKQNKKNEIRSLLLRRNRDRIFHIKLSKLYNWSNCSQFCFLCFHFVLSRFVFFLIIEKCFCSTEFCFYFFFLYLYSLANFQCDFWFLCILKA